MNGSRERADGNANRSRVLYLGDDGLDGAAAYLSAAMTHFRIPFDHVESGQRYEGGADYGAYIISDYADRDFAPSARERIVNAVGRGAGLLMFGGWDSFAGGGYAGSPIGNILPVVVDQTEDRVNTSDVCVMFREKNHPVLDGLPFDKPPAIAGYNRICKRQGAETVLSVRRFETEIDDAGHRFVERECTPLLVVGDFGQGRTAAFAGDPAPHWAGGFVDWGDSRISPGGSPVEVGIWYATFMRNLVSWVGRLPQQ